MLYGGIVCCWALNPPASGICKSPCQTSFALRQDAHLTWPNVYGALQLGEFQVLGTATELVSRSADRARGQ